MRPRLGLTILVALCVTAACRDTNATAAPTVRSAADSADQTMFGVRFFVTDVGIRRAEVESDTAYTFEENTRTEMLGVKASFFKPNGDKNADLTSRRGTYNSRLGSMEARGDVVLIATDGRKLTSQHLRYDPSRNEVASDSAFVLTESSGRVSEGVGFVADPDLNSIKINRAARSRGNPVTIPRQ
jgi:LPS export ABC transporter protein LptC